ncbi:TerB family tellurite resistance protein [Hyphococcus flavus]|uniref:TerB family tellurite resistance protein n=1 Tax=Hyphococcus flavus TaxID=1866326 RepID=A0AAE9ZC50_9PROT|nr:TerB family tellurite resistance protein [Hyphococcus flavus]WDI31636.1 TerB family tellurite resistance protein [Hyphococcus flavus]
MLDKLFDRFKQQTPSDEAQEIDALQLAFAALLVEAARADEIYAQHEIEIIDRALMNKFSIDAGSAAALRTKAEAVQENANDIQRFTRVAKEMSEDEKISLLEEIWEIILSDGDRDSFEDTLVRRICGLIYVDDRESGQARQRVEARLKR